MSILQQVLSILMAIIIADPACCCTFTSGPHGAEKTAHSCCQSAPSDSQNDSQPDKKGRSQCHCADNPSDLPSQVADLSPAPISILPEPTFAPTRAFAHALTTQLTLEQLALPPPPPHRVRYQIFRL